MLKLQHKFINFEMKMRKFLNTYLGAFLLAWWQVVLVSVNTYQVANHKWVGMALFGFWISLFWTYNVSIVVFSDIKMRIVYGFGGMCGVTTGGIGTWYYYIH